jgi:hypothetical protein
VCEAVKNGDDDGTIGDPAEQPRKRSQTEALTIDQVEIDIGSAKQKTKKTKKDAYHEKKARSQFACPFQRLDPLKHHECLKYALHRIKDVKQHLYRRHKQPDYYCARCFHIFTTADAREEHVRSKNCDNLEAPKFEGITDMQKKRLNKTSSRGLDPQEQWFSMWDIIFPNKSRPSSVMIGNYIAEMVPLLRNLWSRKKYGILAKAQKHHAMPLDCVVLDEVVESIFDCIEAEPAASLGERAYGFSSQNQRSPMGGESSKSTRPSSVINEQPDVLFAEPQYFIQESNQGPEADYERGFVFGKE